MLWVLSNTRKTVVMNMHTIYIFNFTDRRKQFETF